MRDRFTEFLQTELESITQEGLFKPERVITSPQQALVDVADREVINLCARLIAKISNHFVEKGIN